MSERRRNVSVGRSDDILDSVRRLGDSVTFQHLSESVRNVPRGKIKKLVLKLLSIMPMYHESAR